MANQDDRKISDRQNAQQRSNEKASPQQSQKPQNTQHKNSQQSKVFSAINQKNSAKTSALKDNS